MDLSKQHLRTEIGAQRHALDRLWLTNASIDIISRFQTLETFRTSETIALYKAIGGEVDLEPLFSNAWNSGKRTCIPVFNEETRLYDMAEITEETSFTIGHYGIPEPENPGVLDISDIDLIAVPGVGFDTRGNRLGRGGGYYDQILEGFPGMAIGVCFDFQLVDSIPVEKHDIAVSGIVTETKFVQIQNER